MYTPFKMKGKSPMMKKLIGKQHRLPEHLKAKIEAAPESPAKMKKESATKMKKASMTKMKKESMAKLKKSATKMKKSMAKKKGDINPFSAEYKRMTESQRKRKYGADYKDKIAGKTKRDGTKLKPINRKNISESVSNLNKKIQAGADKLSKNLKKTKTIKIAETLGLKKKKNNGGGSSNGSSSSNGFTSRKGDPYLYRKNNDGTFTTKKGKDGEEITVKKGSKGYDAISSVFKLKKSSAAKMKKAPAKMKKSAAKLKKKTIVGKSDRLKGRLRETGVKKDKLKTAKQTGLTARELRIRRNKEFLPIAIKKGLAPKRPKAGDLSAKGRAELKAYEKFYGNKENVRKLNEAQKKYFKNKK